MKSECCLKILFTNEQKYDKASKLVIEFIKN